VLSQNLIFRCGLCHVTYFSDFGTSIISLQRLEKQTSNFACGLSLKILYHRIQQWSIGACPRSLDLLIEFLDPYNISGKAEVTNPKFLHAD